MGNNNNNIKFEYKDFLQLVNLNEKHQQASISQE